MSSVPRVVRRSQPATAERARRAARSASRTSFDAGESCRCHAKQPFDASGAGRCGGSQRGADRQVREGDRAKHKSAVCGSSYGRASLTNMA